MAIYLYSKPARSKSGSALSEFAPAIYLLIFCAIIPVLNFLMMGVTYCSCILLNNLELREAARTPHSQLVPVFLSLQQNWQLSAMGQLAGLAGPPEADASYYVSNSDTYVNVSTIFTAKSWVKIPFFSSVPGLGANWTYTVSGARILEDPSYAKF